MTTSGILEEQRSLEIQRFWFGELLSSNDFLPSMDIQQRWWKKSSEFDAIIQQNFAQDMLAVQQYFYHPLQNAKDGLVRILNCDQFTRNCYRGSAWMYALDNIALSYSLQMINQGLDKDLHPIERVFVYMPLEHAEDIQLQEMCVALFKTLLKDVPERSSKVFADFVDFAEKHRVIVERFGRFPHRNALLGRASTDEETVFLQQPNSGF